MSSHSMQGTILVVDDTALDRARLVSVVKKLGCKPIEVAHADRVLEVAIQHKPIMVLMDVVMGPPNGFEICRQLREHPETHHIPVVLCSIKSSEVDHQWAKRQGAMGYLSKPIDVEKTRDFLARQWDRFQEASQNAKKRAERRLEEKRLKAQAANSVDEIKQ